MKRMRILGLCMVAAFAITAFAFSATSALALPEYADCIKTGTGKAKFKDANCTEKTTTGNFELKKVVPGKGATEESIGNEKEPLNKVKAKGIGPNAHLETENATTIECTANTSVSEILVKFSPTTGKQLAAKEVKNVVATFTGCTEAGKNCQNEGTGVIKTTTVSGGLKGPFGYIKGKGTKTPEVGQELKPTKAKSTFAEFECETVGKIKVGEGTGKLGDCIIAPFQAGSLDTQSTISKLKFDGINGEFGREQIPQHFEGKTTHCNLETKLGEGPWERSVQVSETEQTSEAPMEINAVA